MEPFCGVTSEKDHKMRSSESDSESYWNERLINAIRKKQGKGKVISEGDKIREVVEALDQGADVDTRDHKNGNTALHIAVRNGFQKIVEFLGQKGARSDIPNHEGKTAMTLAENLGMKEIVSILQDLMPQRSESEVSESIRTSNVMILTDSQRPPTLQDSEDVTRQNHPSRDDDKINMNPNGEEETYDCKSRPVLRFEYQWTQLAFTLQCALQKKDSEFYLATEMVAARKLDDVFLKYTNEKGERVGRFMQVKHTSSDKKMISADSLLEGEGEFCVPNYFKSWREVDKDPVFNGIKTKNLILCTTANVNTKNIFIIRGTNVNVSSADLKRNKITLKVARDPDESFELVRNDGKTAWYKFEAKKESNELLYSKIKATSHIAELAMRLAEHIYLAEPVSFDSNIFKYYHPALAKVIFHRKNDKFQFCAEFIEDRGLSVNVKKFREIFLSEYRSHMMDAQKDNDNEDLVWQDIVKRFRKLDFAAGFGEPTFVRDPQLTNVLKLSDRIVELLKKASKHKKVIIVDRAEPNKVIWDNINRLCGHVLIKQDDIIKFSRLFLKKSPKYQGNIGEFRTAVLSKLGEGYDLAFFKFEIQGSGICTEAALDTKDGMPEDDSVEDEDISRFLEEFTLAVNQPGFDELHEKIGKNMHTITQSLNIHNVSLLGNAFRTKLSHWFMKKGQKQAGKKDYLTYKVGKQMLNEMNGEVVSIRSSGITLMYCERLKPNDVHFKSGMQPVEAFLSEGESDTISDRMLEIVAPQNTLLTALRVYDTLRKMPKYQKLDGFIFTDVDTLKLTSVLYTIMAALELTRYPDLLLVDCGSYSADEYSHELWNPLYEVLKRRDNKKIILITLKDKGLSEQFENGHKTHEDDHNFQNLTDDTQKKLLEKPVTNFQGHKTNISFGELLGIHDSSNIKEDETQDVSEIIDSNTLIELIREDEIRICDDLETLTAKDYYINRTITRQVIIKKDVLKDENIPDLFAIRGGHGKPPSMLAETTEELSPTSKDPPKITILAKTREEEEFKALCEKYDKFNIHWLNLISGKYMWEKSKGDITHLLEYRVSGESNDLYDGNTDLTCFTDINNFNRCEGGDRDNTTHATRLTIEDDQMASHDEPVIFSSTAGMGKTTMLTYLAWKLKKTDPNMLVIKVNLNSHVQAFANLQGESRKSDYNIRNENGAIDFLVEELLKHETELARKVIRRIIKKKCKVALIFDGFDEISPTYEETVNSLLETLARDCIKKLIVASRPHTRKALESKLKVFSYDLEPFQPENCKEFLNTFLKNDKARIEMAQAVLEKLGESIDDRTNGFSGIPLHMKMIAEILQNPESEHLESSGRFADVLDGEPKGSEKIDLIYLYTYFVAMKFDYLFNKRGADPANIDVINQRQSELEKFKETHTKLALDALFDKDKVKEFPPLETDRKINVERYGIITQLNDNGRPQFGHRTYAEYFAAMYVVDIITTGNLNGKVQRIFVKDILLGVNYQTMRAFINCLWENAHGNVFGVGFGGFWLDEYCGSHHQTIFHVAAHEGNGRIIQKILEHLDSIFGNEKASSIAEETDYIDNVNNLSHKGFAIVDRPDDNGRTPLSIAAATCRLLVVKNLCDKGANVNSEDKNGGTPLHRAAVGGKLDVIEYLLGKKANVNSESKNGMTPLHAAAGEGHLNVVKYLLSKGANVNAQSKNGVTPLHAAAVKGHLNVVEYLLSKGANVNAQSKNGVTPLHAAAGEGHLNVVKYLLSKGANVNAQSKNGVTPLHAAAVKGHLNVVEYLLSKGANVNAQSKNGVTPLHAAAGEGHLNVVKYLLSKGANVNAQSKNGVTPLHAAAVNGHLNVVEYLLSKGANVNAQSKNGVRPRHAAAVKGHLNVVEYLLSKEANVNAQSKDGGTPLHQAAAWGKLDVIEYLLGKKANVNSEDKDGVTPLHAAAAKGHLNVVEYLLGKEANVTSEDKDGVTPLHAAAVKGHLNVVEYLLSKEANVTSEDKDGLTPLHAAAGMGHLNVVECLLSKEANVNPEDKDGVTPLHAAAAKGHLNVVEYLLGKEANVNSKSKNGATPLHAAAVKGHLNVVEYLLSKGANLSSEIKDGGTPLHQAAAGGKLDVIEYLLGKEANVNSEEKDGVTPLHAAAGEGHLNVVEYLLSKEANVNAQSKDGGTPLHRAAVGGKLDVIEYLLGKKANVNSESKNGMTPLHAAAEEGHLNVVKYLLSKGANVNAQSKNGVTPLHAAAGEGHLNVVKYLLSKGANVNAQSKNGVTPLHAAAGEGHLNVVKYLLSKGANVNAQSKNGVTPLHAAAVKGHLNVVEYLLSKGANVNAQSKNGVTPLHAAAVKGHLNVVEYLLSKEANVNAQSKDGGTPLHQSAAGGKLDVIEYLLGKEANVNSEDEDGVTPLHAAAVKGHLNVVEYLLSKGANLSSEIKDGGTPLHQAAAGGKLDVIEYLLGKEANVNSEDKDGVTPLHAAAVNGHLNVVEYLLSKGANVNAQSKNGVTPLHAAAGNGHLNVVEYLVSKGANVNSGIRSGLTPLHVAAANGHPNVVEYLRSKRAK